MKQRVWLNRTVFFKELLWADTYMLGIKINYWKWNQNEQVTASNLFQQKEKFKGKKSIGYGQTDRQTDILSKYNGNETWKVSGFNIIFIENWNNSFL